MTSHGDRRRRSTRATSLRAMVSETARFRGPVDDSRTGGGRRLGDYRLIGKLGSGGMGTVWEAEQVSLGRRVALKLLAPHLSLSADTVARFHREAAAGARLKHAGIVVVHEVGEVDGTHYIAQELVPGGFTLSDFLAGVAERSELPAGYYHAVAVLFSSVADALAAAHEAGVIHRDIKPGNILIDENDEPKVADFGLAHVNDDLVHSRTLELAGTPYYMSPEQAMSKAMGIDARTDVFSLGVTLYEALTLRRAFEGDTSQQVLEQIVLVDPPQARQLRSKVPLDLSIICGKAMEKRRQDRYATMADFAADLRRHLANEPIRARPPGPLTRTIKWTRRHPVWSVAGAMAAITLLVTSMLLLRLSYKNDELETQARKSGRALALLDLLGADVLNSGAYEMSVGAPRLDSARESELLVRGQELVDEELRDDPKLRETLEQALAYIHFTRGDSARAEALYRAAIDRHFSGKGQATDVLVSMDILVGFYRATGRDREVLEWTERCFDVASELLGPESEDARHFLGLLMRNEQVVQLVDDPLAFRRRVAAAAVRTFGRTDARTGRAVADLAAALDAAGRPDEAERELREAIVAAESPSGTASRVVARCQTELARLLAAQDRLDEAARLLEDAVAGLTDLNGALHPDTQQVRASLRDVYRSQGRVEESEVLDTVLAREPMRNWSPLQATGVPNSTGGDDEATAWAPLEKNSGPEWLEVDFDPPLMAHAVRVHESFNAGALVELVLIGDAGEELAHIPVPRTSRQAPTVVEVGFAVPAAPVRTVRLELDTSLVPGWNEIDAVELVGVTARAWAVDARASSFYNVD